MPNTMQVGRVGRVYVAKQSAYRTAPTFAATDAVRHLEAGLNINPRNRQDAPDRNTHPSLITRRTRKTTAEWKLGGIFFPSGTLNTLPDHTDILECGMGAVSNIILATTFSGTPTTTTGTIASAAGLAVGQAVLISIAAGAFAGKYVRWLTTASTSAVWTPALPAAPLAGDSLKGCITYRLSTDLPNALEVGHYLTSVSKEGDGCVINELRFDFDANDEVRWRASGPMADRLTAAQAEPGAFTVVGSAPPSGLTATMRVGSAAHEFLKASVVINNGMMLDNYASGITKAQAFFREQRRRIEIEINEMYSSDVTLMTAAEGTTDNAALVQAGQTEGSIIAVYCPTMEIDGTPDDPDADGTNEHTYKGVAKGTIGNDEFYLAVA